MEENIELSISNSGLILFWPFLTRFFEQLDMLKNDAFINNESRNRAVYLLQYLVYNQIDFPEYEWVLNKLFVGMPLQDNLLPIAELTKDEKDLANSLIIGGLIHNWDKVQNTTVEGIQATFLQREGIINIKQESITLVVEKKGVDVLLNSIPWNISFIKLPWIQKPIYIEWI